jgi:wyosine [tRNA(Phe)-imidazoG37] synthetase (radical SAM superfamily)
MLLFGPVPSRRLGHSLGINNIPPKSCTYSCVYCQVGPTPGTEMIPRPFYEPARSVQDVQQHLALLRARGEQVDYLSFVPDGEPTLDAKPGETIDRLRPLGIPIAVISNGSLLSRKDVGEQVAKANWVSIKVDTIDQDLWRRINRPHPTLNHEEILEVILAFASRYKGTLATETHADTGGGMTRAPMPRPLAGLWRSSYRKGPTCRFRYVPRQSEKCSPQTRIGSIAFFRSSADSSLTWNS